MALGGAWVAEQNTLFNAASAYMDVIRDRQTATPTERNLEFLTEQVRAARSRFEVGEGTRTDIAQAEASRPQAVVLLSEARARVQSSEAIKDKWFGLRTPTVAETWVSSRSGTEHVVLIAYRMS